ncbi:MAG: 3-deoxy-D-manno-octulosonic acid transferase [Magnetococcus sp. WYHC-3]
MPFYWILTVLLFVLALPLLLWRQVRTDRYRGTLGQRFGLDLPPRPLNPSPLWLHAVSVGEVLAARDLARALSRRFPRHPLLITTVTRTGMEVARREIPAAAGYRYLPLDLPGVVQRVVQRTNPCALILMETELWPGLIHAMAHRGRPVVVVNARLSPRSVRGYRRLRFLLRPAWGGLTAILAQSPEDRTRFIDIGIPAHRVQVTGNLKFDRAGILPDAESMQELFQKMPPLADPVLLAASTHPGEEPAVLAAYGALRQINPTWRLILVPRHPHRAAEVVHLVQAHGEPSQLFSTLNGPWSTPVMVVDQVGWLYRLYGLAQMVFVGGSLIPHGGQNPLEAAAWGLVPVFGPHTNNFHSITATLLQQGAALRVADAAQLTSTLCALAGDAQRRADLGKRARAVVKENQGALERTLAHLEEILTQQEGPCG